MRYLPSRISIARSRRSALRTRVRSTGLILSQALACLRLPEMIKAGKRRAEIGDPGGAGRVHASWLAAIGSGRGMRVETRDVCLRAWRRGGVMRNHPVIVRVAIARCPGCGTFKTFQLMINWTVVTPNSSFPYLCISSTGHLRMHNNHALTVLCVY